MYKITLEVASNGVIKTVSDDNSNGNGELFEQQTVYQLEGDEMHDFERTREFLFELSEDLGIDLGSKHTRRRVVIGTEYGENYNETEEELKVLLREHQYEVKWIRETLKNIREARKNSEE